MACFPAVGYETHEVHGVCSVTCPVSQGMVAGLEGKGTELRDRHQSDVVPFAHLEFVLCLFPSPSDSRVNLAGLVIKVCDLRHKARKSVGGP